MSGICGIVNWDGKPVDPELLKKMAEAAAYRGPDGIRYWIEGNVGFAHLALNTTPESLRERQPLVNRRGDLVLTADARVDNRDELIRTLTSKGYIEEKDPTDADLILASYECWGEDCPKYIIGDFAFAVWDKRERKLFAACDPNGYRPFYYFHTKHSFKWSSEIVQLLADPDFLPELNIEMVAHDLGSYRHAGKHESYYQGIYKLSSAEKLSTKYNSQRIDIYWDIDPHKETIYKNVEDYATHFRELFTQAVCNRLRCIRPVYLFMSGGLDSTSIAAVAANEMMKGNLNSPISFNTVSFTSNKSPLETEQICIDSMVDKWNLDHTNWNIDEYLPLYDFPKIPVHHDEPFLIPWYSFFDSFVRYNITTPSVFMTGLDGDLVAGVGNPFYYLELIKSGQFNKTYEILDIDSKRLGVTPFWIIRNILVRPYVSYIKANKLSWLRNLIKGDRARVPHWITAQLIDKTKLIEWVKNQPSNLFYNGSDNNRKFLDGAKNWRYQMLKDNSNMRIRSYFTRLASSYGSEFNCPWDDIRLAEYILSMPQSLVNPGVNRKLIVRNALENFLPSDIKESLGFKTGPEEWVIDAFRKPEIVSTINKIFDLDEFRSGRFVDAVALTKVFSQVESGKRKISMSIWMPLILEVWMKRFSQ